MVGERHLRLRLALGDRHFSAMRFGSPDNVADRIEAIYRIELNEFQGDISVQLIIESVL